LRWPHDFLHRLVSTGFPGPAPVDDLAGDSLAVADGAIWELWTYQPGRVLGWCRRSSLWQVGHIIARFHAASEQIGNFAQRPGALPLAACWPVTPSIQETVRQFHDQLDVLSYATARRCVIHGDPTSHNVLVGGRPSHPSNLIDFTLAYHEAAIADVAFALWRSGRPAQDALYCDVGRVTALVWGYRRVRPLDAGEADLIPVLMLGRGLQMLVRAESQKQPDEALLA
jgi:Ser/Thr protein kinase RdoA (MazF antagonist)